MKKLTKRALQAKQRRKTKWIEVIQFYGSICGICGLPGANQVHEVIITRGDWPGHDDVITDPRNCLVVHEQCHRKAERNKDLAIAHLVRRHGCVAVKGFVAEMRQMGYTGKVRNFCEENML